MALNTDYSLYAQVYVDIETSRLDRPFTYGVPESLKHSLYIGAPVKVPFRNRIILGYVVEMTEVPAGLPKEARVKPIEEVVDAGSLWDREMLKLARWIENYYASGFLQALKVLVPGPVLPKSEGKIHRKLITMARLLMPADTAKSLLRKGAKSQLSALKCLIRAVLPIPASALCKESGAPLKALRDLEKKGILELYDDFPELSLPGTCIVNSKDRPVLSEDQQKVMDRLLLLYNQNELKVALLHGITGSGKTEIYLRMAEHALKEGRTTLILVPEISLTPQAVERFENRFSGQVAVLHSRLTDSERRQQWWKIKEGQSPVVLGARSAVFAPLENIGLIVVDEEHEESYKQEKEPRYHARQVAIMRGNHHNALVILGSATPSLESYHMSKTGKYEYLELPRRIGQSVLPEIHVADLKSDFKTQKESPIKKASHGAIGDTLRNEIHKVLGRGRQAILFLNRRGFASFILCRECGNVIRCPHCDISLTFHKSQRLLKCHYCHYQRPAPDLCPFCGGTKLEPIATAIQKVEEEILALYPGVGCLRMDRDTTRAMEDHYRILEEFSKGRAQILLGTQMVAKGLDFPGVTLVGVINADVSLHMPDFRSLERTYQLLTQVSGRAGRRDLPGKVIIQTYSPESPVITAVAEKNYDEFFTWESENRRRLNYPPFAHLTNLIFTGPKEDKVREYALIFSDILRDRRFSDTFLAILGPSPCFLTKIKDRFRWHVTLKGEKALRMSAVIKAVALKIPPPGNVHLSVDVDPVNLM